MRMKTKIGAILLLIVLSGTLFSRLGNAQINTPDGDICKRNYSIYKGFFDNQEYEDAYPAWKETLKECPTFSRNIYSHGVKMVKYFIENESDIVQREGLIDTLMILYDLRIKYFGNNQKYPEGYILGEKGVDLLKYRKDDIENGYEILSKAIKLWGNNSKPHVIITFMNVNSHMSKMGLLEAEEVIKNYTTCMEISEHNLEKKQGDKGYTMAKSETEKYFTNSGAADCEALIELFEPKYNENPDDLDLLRKINSYLIRNKCTDSDLFMKVNESLYKTEPSAKIAHSIAQRFMIKENHIKALEYLENAINLVIDDLDKAEYFYEMAQVLYLYKADYKKARDLAKKSIELKPEWGLPYMLIGKIYISAYKNFGENDFDKSTVFWVAVDYFKKAKSVDPTVSEEASKLIKMYSEYFPISDDIFYRVLNFGDPYTVKGWINERTTIRPRKK